MTRQATKFDILLELLPELEAQGYEVFLRPNQKLVPKFLRSFMPDAVALRDDRKIAIEVIRKSRENERRIKQVEELFKDHKDWQFRVIWISPTEPTVTLPSQTLSLIRTRISEIKNLVKDGHLLPAFLLAWATFEAVGRLLLPEKLERPQTPGRLVQVLASDGYLTPTEADNLRQLAEKRNKLVHGELNVRISKSNVIEMASILSMLTKLVDKQPVH